MTDATKPAGDPVGWLCRTKQQVIDAEKAFPGEPHDYLWKYTHGTKDMERFAAFPDLDVMPLYAAPPVSGITAALADRERAIAEAAESHRIALREWAVSRWRAEVEHRPLVNIHRRSLDDAWRQVMRYAGLAPDDAVGPSHDELSARSGAKG